MFDNDDLLNDAFDDFSTATAPSVRAQGAQAVRTTVRHRRTVRAVTLSVLAALIVAVPVTAYSLSTQHGQGPPLSPAVSSTPSPTFAPSPAPSATPSETPSSTPTVVTATPGKGGALTISQLTAGRVTIPAWLNSVTGACKSGSQKLAKGTGAVLHGSNQNGLQIYQVAYTDLDADPQLETAALITCQYGEAARAQVVAFDRDSAGHIVTLGRVAEGVIWSVTANRAGVTVNVSDTEACCETPTPYEIHQQRIYGWDGSAFVQTGGPTSFMSHSKPNTYVVKVIKSAWSGPAKGVERPLVVTVSITNTGPYDSQDLLVWDSSGNTDVGKEGPGLKIVHGLAPGRSETVELTIQWPVGMNTNMAVTLYEMGAMKFQTDKYSPFQLVQYTLPK